MLAFPCSYLATACVHHRRLLFGFKAASSQAVLVLLAASLVASYIPICSRLLLSLT
jgi:hypothetical protein